MTQAIVRRMAILGEDGVVQNIVAVEDGADWSPPEGTTLVDDDGSAMIGARYVAGAFLPPEPRPQETQAMSIEDQVRALQEQVAQLSGAGDPGASG